MKTKKYQNSTSKKLFPPPPPPPPTTPPLIVECGEGGRCGISGCNSEHPNIGGQQLLEHRAALTGLQVEEQPGEPALPGHRRQGCIQGHGVQVGRGEGHQAGGAWLGGWMERGADLEKGTT